MDTTLEEIDFANPLSIVTDMRIALNPSETSAVQFDAFRVSSSYEGLKTGIWTDSTSTLDGIRLGDVIKTATDGNGYVRSDGGVELVWSVNSWNDPSNKWINTEPIRDGNYYYQTIVGYYIAFQVTRQE